MHGNIAVFIPHLGCPHACSFCDQRSISGAERPVTPEEVSALLREAFARKPDPACTEIAFFGGSFTGIDRTLMVRLLCDAYAYVRAGKVDSIRLSTRPDYISAEILDILKSYGVKSVELGIQSMDDTVLALEKYRVFCVKEKKL